ncbi:MAG: acyltransferase domain-containing protein [Spirochaetaceae bacterium]
MDYYDALLKRFEFLTEDYEYLIDVGDKILNEYKKDIFIAIETFYNSNFSSEEIESILTVISEKSNIDLYTINFIFLAVASERLKDEYMNRGYGEQLFWDSIIDLKYKAKECQVRKDVLGIIRMSWYSRLFRLNIVTIGRLQYERNVYPKDLYVKKGVSVKKGDVVYSVHIPSSGPLTEELRYESYKKAYEILVGASDSSHLICICDTWLLYEENRKIFPASLNTVRFMDDWDIIENRKDVEFSDAWRLFGVPYTGDPKHLPQHTAMQKYMVKWLKQGGSAGLGFGILIHDGECIL